MTTRKLAADVRLTPSHALHRILRLMCAMTGAAFEETLIRRRGSTVDTARNLALHFLVECEGYQVTKLALAFPPDEKTGKPRHWTSPRNNHHQGWELREATRPDSEDLFDWLRVHWKDPLGAHRTMLAKRRRAFQAAIAAAEARRGTKRLEASDLADAVTAMIRAAPILIKPAPDQKPRASTSVPVFDEIPALTMLRMAPAVTQTNAQLIVSPAPSGGHFIEAILGNGGPATALLRTMARLLDSAGFNVMQRGVFPAGLPGDGRIKSVIHVAAAACALIGAIHMSALSRIVQPIGGAPSHSHGPSFATA